MSAVLASWHRYRTPVLIDIALLPEFRRRGTGRGRGIGDVVKLKVEKYLESHSSQALHQARAATRE